MGIIVCGIIVAVLLKLFMRNQKNSYLVKLGKNIRKRRLELNISQENLADKADLDRSYIGGIERGERNITILSLLKIIKTLDCTIENLFKDI